MNDTATMLGSGLVLIVSVVFLIISVVWLVLPFILIAKFNRAIRTLDTISGQVAVLEHIANKETRVER